jgi:hypothetical protein
MSVNTSFYDIVIEQKENQLNIGADLLQQAESDEKFIKLIIVDIGTTIINWVQ